MQEIGETKVADEPTSEQVVTDQPGETQGTPAPAQPSEQAAVQDDRYWQGTHDRMVNSQEYKDAQSLYTLYKDTPGLLDNTKEFLKTGDEPAKTPDNDFDASIDFEINDVFTNPSSNSAKLFNEIVQKAVEPIVQERVGKLEAVNQRAQFRDRFLSMGIPKGEVDEFIDNLQNPTEDFIFNQMGPLVAQHFKQTAQQVTQAPEGVVQPNPGESNLDSVRETQAGPAVTGPVQGAAPAAQSEVDGIWDGIASQTIESPF